MPTIPSPLPNLTVSGATVDFPRQDGPAVSPKMRTLLAALLIVGIMCAGVLAPAGSAHAGPPCAQFDACPYMPNPYNNGPLMPTWELPGGYGLPGGDPTMCDPSAYRCYPAAPGSGF